MPRVVKHPDIRRAELLDRAVGLFVQRGYQNVSLNDLIADAGVSKGAFYHWFPSKDALVAALAERSARDAFAGVEDALAASDGDALDRLNAVLRAGFDINLTMSGPEQLAAMVALLRPDNVIYGLAARTNSNIVDVLDAANETARERAIDALTTRFRLHGLAVDRILGLPDGSIATLSRAQVEAMVAALPRRY